MISIRSWAEMTRALASPIDADLIRLLALRREQLPLQVPAPAAPVTLPVTQTPAAVVEPIAAAVPTGG
jgi:hypothetical protein